MCPGDSAIAIARDGRQAARVIVDGAGGRGEIGEITIADDGSWLVVRGRSPGAGQAAPVSAWDASGQLLWRLTPGEVSAVALSPTTAALATRDAIVLIDRAGAITRQERTGPAVRQLAFGADGVLAAADAEKVELWRASAPPERIWPRGACPVQGPIDTWLRWSADGSELLLVDRSWQKLGSWPEHEPVGSSVVGHDEALLGASFTSMGTLFTVSAGGWYEWSVPEGRPIASGRPDAPLVAWSADGERRLSCAADALSAHARDGTLLWSVPAGDGLPQMSVDGRIALVSTPRGFEIWRDGARALEGAGERAWLASDGLAVYVVRAGELLHVALDGGETAIGRTLPTQLIGTSRSLWFEARPAGILWWRPGAAPVALTEQGCEWLAMSADGRWLALADEEQIQIWDDVGRHHITFSTDPPSVAAPILSADGGRLATFAGDGLVTVWDLAAMVASAP